MAGLTIWCTKCHAGYGSVGEIPAVCPSCSAETTWTTFAPPSVPRVQWTLTLNDRRFLRSVRIAHDDDSPVRR